MLSYGPLVTSAVAGQQLRSSMSMGNILDVAHRGGSEATPTVVEVDTKRDGRSLVNAR